MASEPLETWKDYLTFHALEHSAAVLPEAFGEERFAFHGTVLAGTPQRRDRWKRAVDATSDALGDAVGQLYVEKYFPPAAKARVEAMVRNMHGRLRPPHRRPRLDGARDQGQGQGQAGRAEGRASAIPDKWRDYSGLEIVRGDAFGNAQRAELFEYRRNLRKLGQPVDRGEWVMTPQTVNAVNLPVDERHELPGRHPAAAVLRPRAAGGHGLRRHRRRRSATRSATASTTRARCSTTTGRLRNWWTAEDLAHFEASGAQLVKQYDAYKPFPDLAVNGKLTLSENIADVAGLAAAYDAYRLSLGGKPAPVVAGLTGDQQFFLSFAQSWRLKVREPALRQQVAAATATRPTSTARDTVRNLDAWYEAFDVKPGQAPLPEPGASACGCGEGQNTMTSAV